MRYGAVTDATGPEVISRAIAVFGQAGLGLRLTERGLLNARLENQVGHVAIEVSRTGDRRTEVTIETREYDREVIAFIERLPSYTRLGRLIRQRRRAR